MITKVRTYEEFKNLKTGEKINFYQTSMYFLGFATDRRFRGVKQGLPEVLCLKSIENYAPAQVIIRPEECAPGKAGLIIKLLSENDKKVKIYNEIVGGKLQ